MLGQFTGEEETDSGLDLPRGDGGSLVVVGETGSLSGDSLEDIVDKAVHDGHSFAADTGIGVNLFQHLVDVDAVTFLPPPLLLLVADTCGLCLTGLLGSLRTNLRWHVDIQAVRECVAPATNDSFYTAAKGIGSEVLSARTSEKTS